MALELTFKQVCQMIKKDQTGCQEAIETTDRLLGLVLACSPIALGPAAVALLPLIAVKNEMVKVAKGVLTRLIDKRDEDYMARHHRMQLAYNLIVFTSFFEALDRQISDSLRKQLKGLCDDEKKLRALVKSRGALHVDVGGDSTVYLSAAESNPLANRPIAFLHPCDSLANQAAVHAEIWKQMAAGFTELVKQLSIGATPPDDKLSDMVDEIANVPDLAAKYFEAQYFELARRFEDFAIWVNLQEHKRSQSVLESLSKYVKLHSRLSSEAKEAIDVGFERMHEAVLAIPEVLKTAQSTEIADGLAQHYRHRVQDPIADDKEDADSNKVRLRFPRICDAFIPQSFRVLRYSSKLRSLEDESTWQNIDRRNDLGAFLLSYLCSPYSTETPLVILGHPGSGKSLLTTVLSAQLMSSHFTAVRVPLREVDAEAGIVSQIEERIRYITNVSVDSWAKLSGAFKNNPPLVILDGYDELLQASGKVFSGYLKDVQHFQKNEAEQGRPVRTIVTSRVTLIDKASIPEGTTVVRLLEFDKRQRDRWISIWNKENADYFKRADVRQFMLPSETDDGAAKVLSLAEQPLLLLMLALYDSEGNQLRKSKSLDRTMLYDSLLRRFVRRERAKDKHFYDLPGAEQKKELDNDMQRLAIAALGMYNRRKLHILASELNDDLKFFNLERPSCVTSGRPLTQADLLLGSFFFVHKSTAQRKAGAQIHHEESAAFEFMHNTFGEFLTADFILRQTLTEVAALKALQENEDLRPQLEQRLGAADGLSRAWFASMVYTPLFTRPVVLEMVREWVGHVLKSRGMNTADFHSHLDTIILNQLRRLLDKREMPSIIRKETAQEGYRAPFGDHPLLGHIAIYSINLVLLRAVVGREPFIFHEDQVGTHEDGARPWDRLTNIWRSWFSLDNLNGVTAILVTKRFDSGVVAAEAKTLFRLAEGRGRLDTCLNVAVSLGDNISSGLTGILCFHPMRSNPLSLTDIQRCLQTEKIDADLPLMLAKLSSFVQCQDRLDFAELTETAASAFRLAIQEERSPELSQISYCLREAVRRWFAGNAKSERGHIDRLELFRRAFEPSLVLELGWRNVPAAVTFIETAKDIGDWEWLRECRHRIVEVRVRGRSIEQDREALIGWIELVVQLGGRIVHSSRDLDVFEHALRLDIVSDLLMRSPHVALEFILQVRHSVDTRQWERIVRELRERPSFVPWCVNLAWRSPEDWKTLLQLAMEVGGQQAQSKVRSALLNLLLDPDYVYEATERHSASAWLSLARDLVDRGALENVTRERMERLIRSHILGDIIERNPESALVYLRVAESVAPDVIPQGIRDQLLIEVFRHPRFHPMVVRDPETALEWLRFAGGIDGSKLTSSMDPEYIDAEFSSPHFIEFLWRQPSNAASLLRLIRGCGEGRVMRKTLDRMFLFLSRSDRGKEVMNELPVSAIADLQWLVAHDRIPSNQNKRFVRMWLEENGLAGIG